MDQEEVGGVDPSHTNAPVFNNGERAWMKIGTEILSPLVGESEREGAESHLSLADPPSSAGYDD